LGDATQVLQLLEQVRCLDNFPDQVLPI